VRAPLAIALGVLACCLAVPAIAEPPFSFDSTQGKLPKTVVPLDYDIALRPDVRALTFTGSETVSLRVRSATNSVIFNTHDLRVTTAAFDGRRVTAISSDAQKQLTTVRLPAAASVGRHVLRLSFAGKIGDQPQGLFYQK